MFGPAIAAAAEGTAITYEVKTAASTAASYAQEDKRFKAGKVDPAFRPKDAADPDRPLMTDYKNLAAIKGMIAKHLPEGKIDGKSVEADFAEIDFTKPENYMAYRRAMNRESVAQGNIKKTDTSTFRWFGGGKNSNKRDAADSQLNLLAAAEKDFGDFEQRVLKYSSDKAKQAAEAVASHGVSDPAPGKKDTAVQAPAAASGGKASTDKTAKR